MAGLKHSRQRDAVLTFMQSTTSHPTAEDVYSVVKQEFPKVSLGTIYRNLNLLVDQGDLIRIRCGDGVEHFDATVESHNHFICRVCGRVQDVDWEFSSDINQAAEKCCSGKIEGHELYFYGTCNQCL